MVTHIGARYGGPAWLAAGTVVYLVVRRRSGTGLLEHVEATTERELPPEAAFSKILVPMKLGEIGEEMIATAVKLAQERAAQRRRDPRHPRAARPAARRRALDEEERARGVARRGGRSSATTSASRSRAARSARGRSARRSSRRRRRAAPTSSSSARRRAGAASRGSSRRPSTTSCARRRPRCSSSPSRRASSKRPDGLRSARMDVKALVIGCGRVGSSIALELHREGWDVTVVDENEDALSRLGEGWPGTFIVGHGMDADLLRDAGHRGRGRRRRRDGRRQHEHHHRPGRAEAVRRALRRRARPRSGAREVLRRARPRRRLPDERLDRPV